LLVALIGFGFSAFTSIASPPEDRVPRGDYCFGASHKAVVEGKKIYIYSNGSLNTVYTIKEYTYNGEYRPATFTFIDEDGREYDGALSGSGRGNDKFKLTVGNNKIYEKCD